MTPANKGRLIAAFALPLLALNVSQAHAAPAAVAERRTQLPTIALVTTHISIMVTGAGSPVFLIPGLSSPREVWDGVVPDLAKNHTVYLVQVNGFGAGDSPGANLQPGVLDAVVSDLNNYIVGEKIK